MTVVAIPASVPSPARTQVRRRVEINMAEGIAHFVPVAPNQLLNCTLETCGVIFDRRTQ